MSKRSHKADNSKRQQPVQQQRAEAARQTAGQPKATKRSDESTQERSARKTER
jgi:hypothetical protein